MKSTKDVRAMVALKIQPTSEKLEDYLADYLENICKDTKDTIEADQKANEYAKKIGNSEDAWEADWWNTQVAFQHERQGFFGGFMYAMALLTGTRVMDNIVLTGGIGA